MLKDREGNVLLLFSLRSGLDLGDQQLRRADFRGVTLENLNLAGADLRQADFSGSDLYWLDLYSSDCSGASFRHAHLEGANFKSCCLRRADFTGTVVVQDRLNIPSSFAHADLTGAILDGAHLVGAEYDDKTIFPVNFDAIAHGMTFVKREDDSLIEPPRKESGHSRF